MRHLAFALLAATVLAGASAPAEAGASASLTAPNPATSSAADNAKSLMPTVLSDNDVTRYRQIIAYERQGSFEKAQKLIDRLDDTTLMGYVEAEKLLSPQAGKAKVTALVQWLKTYKDLPIAGRVRALAVERATKKVKRRHHRVTVLTTAIPGIPAARHRGGGLEELEQNEPPVTAAARSTRDQIARAVHSDAPDKAASALQNLVASGRGTSADTAKLSRLVCTSYLIEGMDEKALALGESAATTGRKDAPLIDWCAGLAAFRLQQYPVAAQHFATLATVSDLPNTTLAAAAFWAARSYQRAGNPDPVVALLEQAAGYQPTFYGLLAEQALGRDLQTGFSEPSLNPGDFEKLMVNAPNRRAVALWQVGDKNYTHYINDEINRGFGQGADLNLDIAFAYLARKLGVPNLELRASETAAVSGGPLLTGLFPFPPYQPLGGYTIDSALVLAFVRVETRYQTNAVSPVGAAGLMQLMPATARRIGGAAATTDALLDPGYNMSLGQRYIARMLNGYNGNLIKLAAAYNAGPGKVARWQAAQRGREDDPLVFLESIRAPETRSYVKRVLTYYWMYHRRIGEDAPSLAELTRGEWPIYHPPLQTAPPKPPAEPVDDEAGEDTPVS
ncbi:MAG: lytic transglycosylase domain-containing protein [Rhizomicrobium sp.]